MVGSVYVLNRADDSVFLTEPMNTTLHPNDIYQAPVIVNDGSGSVWGKFTCLQKSNVTISGSQTDIAPVLSKQSLFESSTVQGILFTFTFNETLLEKLIEDDNIMCSYDPLLIKVQFIHQNNNRNKEPTLSKVAYIHLAIPKLNEDDKVIPTTETTVTVLESTVSIETFTGGVSFNIAVDNRCILLHSNGLILLVSFLFMLIIVCEQSTA